MSDTDTRDNAVSARVQQVQERLGRVDLEDVQLRQRRAGHAIEPANGDRLGDRLAIGEVKALLQVEDKRLRIRRVPGDGQLRHAARLVIQSRQVQPLSESLEGHLEFLRGRCW